MTDQQRTGSNGNELARRIAALSPEKRALLEARLGNREASPDAGASKKAQLSFAQERIYKLVQGDPESGFFVSVARIRIPPPVDLQALRAGLASVAQRHEALRTGLEVEQGRPALVLHDAPPELTILEDPAELERRIAEAVAAVRMLTAPLFRAIAFVLQDVGRTPASAADPLVGSSDFA
jgi:hypothetical protein